MNTLLKFFIITFSLSLFGQEVVQPIENIEKDELEGAQAITPETPDSKIMQPSKQASDSDLENESKLQPEAGSESGPGKGASSFTFNVDGRHLEQVDQNIDPYSEISMGVTYLNDSRLFVSLSQSIIRKQILGEGEREFNQADTVVSFGKETFGGLFGIEFGLVGSFSIPTSEASRRDDVISRTSVFLPIVKELSSRLRIFITPYTAYNFNQFQTAEASRAGGGVPLPWYRFGSSVAVSYKYTDQFSFRLSGSYGWVYYEQTDDTVVDEVLREFDEPYSVSISGSYLISEAFSVNAGFIQGSLLQQGGQLEFLIFDEATSQVFLGANYSTTID